jgi:predicted DNA-binding transcriptional regulator YafY
MPQIKNALIRFRIIDRCLRNKYKPFPTKSDIRTACEEALFGSEDGVNICDSTIEKDMFAMKMDHDAPIKYSKREGGYYYTDDSFSINDIPLSEDDIEAIKFATNTLIHFRDSAMFKQFGFAIDKIFDRVNISKDPNAADIGNFVQFEVGVSAKGNEFLAPILNAIRSKSILEFDYESFINGKKKSRRVVPLLLKEYRNRWYLISFDIDKEAIVTYALERMSELEETNKKFKNPINFDANLFFKNAVGITASETAQPVKVVLKADNIAAKYIESQPFHHSQKIEKQGKNKTVFTMQVLVSEELIRSFLSYGGEIEVVEPIALREQMIKRLKEMSAKYEVD